MQQSKYFRGLALGLLALLTACQAGPMGFGEGTAGQRNAKTTAREGEVEHCAAPLGTVLVSEGRVASTDQNVANLPPTSVLMRAMIQHSNCFSLVEKAVTSDGSGSRMMTEYDRGRQPQSTAQGSAASAAAADFELVPAYQFKSESQRTSGIGRAVSGIFGGSRYSSALGTLGDSVQTREVVAQMSLLNARTRVPVAVSDSRFSKTDAEDLRSSLGSGLGAYTDTPQGKVVTMAMVDAFNKIVVNVRASQKSKADKAS